MANSSQPRCEGQSHKLEGREAREYLRTRGESESLRKGSTWDHIKERIRMNAKEVHQPVDPFGPHFELDHNKWIDSISHILGCCQTNPSFKINCILFEEYARTLMGDDAQIVDNIHLEKIHHHEPGGVKIIFEIRWTFLARQKDDTHRWIPAIKEFTDARDDARHMVQYVNWLNLHAVWRTEEEETEFPF